MAYSFGSEETQEKGVVLLDTRTKEQRFVSLKPLRGRKTVKGALEEILAREDLKEDYLRLYVTDRYAGLELQARLREQFPCLLEIYGKGLTEETGMSGLSLEELGSLDETDIMEKFLGEHFDYAPDEDQLELFRQVLAWSREEEEV